MIYIVGIITSDGVECWYNVYTVFPTLAEAQICCQALNEKTTNPESPYQGSTEYDVRGWEFGALVPYFEQDPP